MRKDFILFGAIFFFIASFLNVAMARNSPNIFNKDTGEVISVRHGASFMFTFNPDGSNFNYVPEITGYAYFNAITYGNNTYVAVADDATIWYSKNNGRGSVNRCVKGFRRLSSSAAFSLAQRLRP